MMKSIRNIKSKILLVILIAAVAVLIACDTVEEGGVSDPNAINGQTENGTEDAVDESAGPIGSLPNAIDMDGRVFTFITSNWPSEAVWTVTDIIAEEMTGEALNDAIYMRNAEVETRLNVEIREINLSACHYAYSRVDRAVTAGSNDYDFFLSRLGIFMGRAQRGSIIDLHRLGEVDFANPWWDQSSVASLSIAHKLFAVASDITTMDNAATSAIVFNKQLLADHALPNPYQLVRDGNWTLETFFDMVRQVSADLNGDGVMDHHDRFGFLYQRDTLLSFFAGSGEAIGRKDENDLPFITINEDGAMTQMLRILEHLYDRDTAYNVMMLPVPDFNVGADALFQNDQGLFMWIRMANVVALRSMPTDFGILPIPKRDIHQAYHSSDVNSWTGVVLTVPATNIDYRETSIFLEFLAEASGRLVQPAYRDILLDGIIARDEDSLEMLDIIFNNRTFDIGAIGRFGELRDVLWRTMYFDMNIASWVDARMNIANRDIDRFVERILELH